MASIPFDFDNLAALAAARAAQYAPAQNVDNAVSFRDHFQAAAPAAKPTDSSPSNAESSSTTATDRSAESKAINPDSPTNQSLTQPSKASGKTASKSSSDDSPDHDDDSADASLTAAAASGQPPLPPVVPKPDVAKTKGTSVAKDDAKGKTARNAQDLTDEQIKKSADKKGGVQTTSATSAKSVDSNSAGAKHAAADTSTPGAESQLNAADDKGTAKKTEPTNAVPVNVVATNSVAANAPIAATDAAAANATGADAAASASQLAASVPGTTELSPAPVKKGTTAGTEANGKKSAAAELGKSEKQKSSTPDDTAASGSHPLSLKTDGDAATNAAGSAEQNGTIARAKAKKQDSPDAKEDAAPINATAPHAQTPDPVPTTTASSELPKDAALAPIDSKSSSAPAQPSNVDAGTSPFARLPGYLLSQGTDRATTNSPVNGVDQARFVQRVAKAFQAAQDRDGEVRLRLSPPELGALRLEIKVQDGVMTARMEAESPDAKALLIDNLPALRERLAEQGIRVEQFDIDLMNRQPGGNGTDNMPRGNDQAAQQANSIRFERERSDAPTSEPPPTRVARVVNGRLNVIV